MPMNHFSPNFPVDAIWLMDPTRMPKDGSEDIVTDKVDDGVNYEREAMFEKPLTPSDVGKLNRLVIPKQHAEKYFPLDGGGGGEQAGEKGLLLSFEDESGKCWRFRYSYWNSSQSYVLTKGWSRYVKEKGLDAGDVVLFERHRAAESDRLFIGWRRRGTAPSPVLVGHAVGVQRMSAGGGCGGGGVPELVDGGGSGSGRVYYNAPGCYTTLGLALPHQPERLHAAGSVTQGQRTPTSSTSTPSGNSKTLRLFGVDLECQLDEPSSDPQSSSDGSPMSSSHGHGHGHGHGPAYNYFDCVANYPQHDPNLQYHNHMDMINFQMGNRLG
ncbi:hypothetical protein Dimus_006972 [Dionaea muscipula]